MSNFLDRTAILLSKEQLTRLNKTRVIVFGVGGVGGALCHFLVRAGVGSLDIVDFDTIDITNINRQLVANSTNVGKLKVEELKTQLLNINPKLKINAYNIKYGEETAYEINFPKYDIIVDCVDDVGAKKLIIKQAKANNVYLLSAMGAGNRVYDIPNFEVCDISKTSYDPLAKVMRKFCADEGIKRIDVCYTKQKAIKNDCKKIGSVVYYPIEMACVMCAHIVNKIIKE